MTDVIVVGGGVAGASAAAFLAEGGVRVTIVESEDAPDRHSTGRSAALWSEYLGGPAVQELTRVSGDWFRDPPPGFTDRPVLTPRGMLALAAPGAEHLVEPAVAAGSGFAEPARELTAKQVHELCPVVEPGSFTGAVLRPSVTDLDVAAVHRGFLRLLRAAGGELVCRAAVTGIERSGAGWRVRTAAGDLTADVVVNAAGAWADDVARLAGATPQGLVPRRRTACVVALPEGADTRDWPALTDLQSTFYLRPEPGAALVSPMDVTPVPAGDVRPDELDVARGLEAAQRFVSVPLRHVRRAWAGLRTHTEADVPLVGPDPVAPGFHWLAGLGGHGIQTAPAVGALLAATITGSVPDRFRTVGTNCQELLRPAELASGSTV